MRAIGWLLIGAAGAGCGYHFAAEGSGLPPSAKTIYVEKFTNRTRVTGINDEFMRYLKDEIDDRKRLQIVDNAADADLTLSGEIIFSEAEPVAFNTASEPTLYANTLTANATLVDNHTHKLVWASSGISGSQQYATVSQSLVTTSPYFLQQNLRSQDIAQMTNIQVEQSQEASSEDLIMQELAQNLYASMSEGF
ncbi:MAG TPA: LptE family protein [Candidatus Binataceae bacterium]|nr:LptE family protein [Candidatus Binataceae bacterium]